MVRWDALTKAVGREVRATRAERSLTTLVHLIFIVVCWASGGVKKVALAYELILSCQPELRISRPDRSEMSVAKLAIETGLPCSLPCFLFSSSLETIGVDRNRVTSCDKFNLRCPKISRGIPDSCRSYGLFQSLRQVPCQPHLKAKLANKCSDSVEKCQSRNIRRAMGR